MNEDFDVEEMLMRYRSDPGERVKRSVLSRFNHTFGGRGSRAGATRFWKRPIPLYLVAANIIIAIGISFFAGQTVSLSERQRDASLEPPQEASGTTAPEVTWEVAPNDLI